MKILPGNSKLGLLAFPVLASALLTGCLEDDGSGSRKTAEELDGLAFDINRAQSILDEQKVKLAAYEKAAADSLLVEKITEDLTMVSKELEDATTRNSELSDEVELTTVEFDQYQSRFRSMVRNATVGTNIDLSEKKGDDYKDVRVLGVDPTAVKVYRPSGPESVAIKDLPASLVEKLQMSEEEAALFRKKQASTIIARAKQFDEWKKKQVAKKDDSSKEAILLKMKEIRLEIYERENVINSKMQQVKAWKSKASVLDARVAEERAQGRRQKSDKLARLARDKADLLEDQIGDSWVVIERLKSELNDLERLEESQ